MKFLSIILILICSASNAQHISSILSQQIAKFDSADVGTGEYQVFFRKPIAKTGHGSGNLSNLGKGSTTGFQGIVYQMNFPTPNLQLNYVAGGLHDGAVIDINMREWNMGENFYYNFGTGNNTASLFPELLETDSAGNVFDSCKQVVKGFKKISGGGSLAGYNITYTIRMVDGKRTLWVHGMALGGLRLNGTDGISADSAVKRPVQVIIPGNREPLKITVENIVGVLCTDGTVWVAGNSTSANLGYTMTGMQYASLVQLTGLTNIKDIGFGIGFHWAITASGDTTYCWGQYGNYMADQTYPSGGGASIPTPIRCINVDNVLPAPIDRVECNSIATYFLLTNGELWGIGNNSEGVMGNGYERTWNSGNCNVRYAWELYNMQATDKIAYPIYITDSCDGVWAEPIYGWYTYFRRVLGNGNRQLYFMGGNKGSVGVDGSRGATSGIVAGRRSSWGRADPVPVDPFTRTTSYSITSPICVYAILFGTCSGDATTTTQCSGTVVSPNTAPVANAGPDQSISNTSTYLDGSGSTDNVYVYKHYWIQKSGPNTAKIDFKASPNPRISNLVDGTYIFVDSVTDNGWLYDVDSVTVNVSSEENTPPEVDAGDNQIIQLPTNSANLNSTATDNGGIASYLWTKDSEPIGSTASFSNSTIADPLINNLIAGTYTLRLRVTDNLGLFTEDVVIITVQEEPPVNEPPVAVIGDAITIKDPVFSVNITGAGSSDDNGIAVYEWTQVDSENPLTIVSPSSVNTLITGFLPGKTYTIKLRVIDDEEAEDEVTVNITCLSRDNFKVTKGVKLRTGQRAL